jgi:hypothetical protein
MLLRFPGFIGPSYTLQSVNADCQRVVNLFPEINALGTGKEREVAALVPAPGKRLLVTLPTSPVRGIYTASNNEIYAVGGNKLYSISSSWVATELGSLNTSTGAVSMADNGTSLVLVDGTDGFSWNMSTDTFAEITDADFLGADQVTFLDGYFLFNKPDSGVFFFSGINDITFDALDIETAEGAPDDLVGIIAARQQLYLLGTQSVEVFYNSGDADTPFQRIQGAVIDVGCSAAFSIAKLEDAIYWLGGDENGRGIVYRMQGYQPQRISTPAIDSVIRELTSSQIASARAWTYQQGGHAFYCLNIPGAESTWVFDTSTNLWHERQYRNSWSLERDRADCHALAHGENVVGDYDNGNLYALDPDRHTDEVVNDAPTPIIRERAAPHFSKNGLNLIHHLFELDMEVGVGIDGTGQGTDPQVMLQWSDDGGHTWSSERWKSIGKIGETRRRVRWTRLGRSRDRVYRVRVSDPVKVVLLGANLDVEEGVA